MPLTFTAGPGTYSRQRTDDEGNLLLNEDNSPKVEEISYSKEWVLLQDDSGSQILFQKATTCVVFEDEKICIYTQNKTGKHTATVNDNDIIFYEGRHSVTYTGTAQEANAYNTIFTE